MDQFPSHVHLVPAKHGILMFRGLQLLKDYANTLYNQGFANEDKAMMEMANKLWKDADECHHAQFGSYSVEHWRLHASKL